MSIKNSSLSLPIKISLYIFILLFTLFFQACSVKNDTKSTILNSSEKKENYAIEKPQKASPPEKEIYNKKYIYEKAIGKNFWSAEKKAKEKLKNKIAKDMKKYLEKKVLDKVITKQEMIEIDSKMLKNIESLSREFKVLDRRKIDTNNSFYRVVAGIDEKGSSKIKKEFLKHLVKVEKRWHSLKEPSSFQKYIVAKSCYKSLIDIIDLYFLADYLYPYSNILKKRVEPTPSFLKSQARKAKKNIKLFIVNSNSPAVSMFNKKVKKELQENGFKVVKSLDKETVCITIKNDLKHIKDSQKYIFQGDIYIKFHKPFSAPFLIKKYSVAAKSKVSGKDALYKAGDAFVKKLKKDLLN